MAQRSISKPVSAWVQVAVCTSGFFLGSLFHQVEGHAFMMAPVSRTFYYTPVFQQAGFAEMEHCPHCMQSKGPAAVRARAEAKTDPTELKVYGGGRWPHYDSYERGELLPNGNYYETDAISVRHGLCGDPGQTQPEGENRYAQDNSMYPVLETLAEGSVVEMKVVMSTYHWGHLEFFICNGDDLPGGSDSPVTQGCFNKYPLDRAEDDGDASPIDPNHPGRYYVDPPCRAAETDQSKPDGTDSGDVVTARYQLPRGLTCERCTIQMVYYTGNSCHHPGYEEFNPPSWPSDCAPNKEDWITTEPGMCGEGDKYPEEFWNCADVSITSGGSTGPSPNPEPAPSPTTPEPEPEATERVPEPTAEQDETKYPTSTSMDDSEWPESPPASEPEPIHPTEPELTPTTPDYSSSSGNAAETDDRMKPGEISSETSAETDDVMDSDETSSSENAAETDDRMEPGEISEEPLDDGVGVCAEDGEQCGGSGWIGLPCCGKGVECVEFNESLHKCVPDRRANKKRGD